MSGQENQVVGNIFISFIMTNSIIYVLQPKVQNLPPPLPPLRPLFCNNSLKLLAARGLWIGISPY